MWITIHHPLWCTPPRDKEGVVGDTELSTSTHIPTATAGSRSIACCCSDRLSRDLAREFPDMKGFSPRNLLFMRAFADGYADETIVKQLVSLLPWEHVVRLASPGPLDHQGVLLNY